KYFFIKLHTDKDGKMHEEEMMKTNKTIAKIALSLTVTVRLNFLVTCQESTPKLAAIPIRDLYAN
ncbi:MAG: hypothetical protein QMA99_09205, partial [Flavobacterium sp.]